MCFCEILQLSYIVHVPTQFKGKTSGMRRVSMAVRGLEPAAADVLAATDGGGALAAFLNSSKGAFERTRDEFFVCAGCCAASGSSRCSLRATSYDDHGVYVLRSTHLARSVPCAH